MILITRKELFIALRRMYETNCVDGTRVELLQDEPLNKYAEMIADVDWRADLHRLQANWTTANGAAQFWFSEGKIDLDIVCHDCATIKGVILKYAPQPDAQLSDPVARWLADTLKPRSIRWSGGDPIAEVLTSVLINGSDCTAERVAKRTAQRLFQLTNDVQAPQPKFNPMPVPVFEVAVLQLRDASGDSVKFSALLRDLFGESLRLRPSNGWLISRDIDVAVVRTKPQRAGWSMVMWASTGKPVFCNMARGRASFDFDNFENMQHLYKCYNAHNKQTGDNLLCSHSTLQKD